MRIRQAKKILKEWTSREPKCMFRRWEYSRKMRHRVAVAARTYYKRKNRLNAKLVHEAWLWQMDRFLTKKAHQYPWMVDIQVDMGTLPAMEPPMDRTFLTNFQFEPQVIESAGQFSGHRTRWIPLPITTTTESD